MTYLAEGTPFEDRCKNALECLREFKISLGAIAEADLKHLQDAQKRADETAAKLRPEFREVIQQRRATNAAATIKASQETMKVTWDAGIDMLKAVVGPDAVEFALKILERERGN